MVPSRLSFPLREINTRFPSLFFFQVNAAGLTLVLANSCEILSLEAHVIHV